MSQQRNFEVNETIAVTAKEAGAAITISIKNSINSANQSCYFQPLKLEYESKQKVVGKRSRRAASSCVRRCPICLYEFRLARTSISEINVHVNKCSESQSRHFGRSKKKVYNPHPHSLAYRIPIPSQSHTNTAKSVKKSHFNLKEKIRPAIPAISSPTSILEVQLPTGLASNENSVILKKEEENTAKVDVSHLKHESRSTKRPIQRKTAFPTELESMLKDILVQRMLLEDST